VVDYELDTTLQVFFTVRLMMAAHFETGTMASPQHYSTRMLNHLGLVSTMVDELGIVEWVDRILPKDQEKQIVSYGQAVKAMILNGLGFNQRTLYLTPHFFQDKPVGRLLGEGIEARHLNDDLLGRTLDAIFRHGPTALYSQLAAQTVSRLGLLCRFGHLDATSFHVDGEYNSAVAPAEGVGVIHITPGYSRDHRPDLNQVVLQLMVERQAGIPLLMEALSGNNSDKRSFRETVKAHLDQLNREFGLEYLIADSALYTADTLGEMNGFYWISRVPETLELARFLIQATAPDLMTNRGQPSFISVGTRYADVEQRWVIVYSPEAYQRATKTVNRASLKQTSAELTAFEHWCRQRFSCETDAHKALSDFEKKLKHTQVFEARLMTEPGYRGRGRPAKNRLPDYQTYRIEGGLASRVEPHQQRLQRKSCFILATNQRDVEALSNEDLIKAYKDQQKVERGFRFLKDPLFMASTLFLKSPERIMALMMVMTLCLLVYAALEYRLRRALHQAQQTFPNQLGQPIANPTARWAFQFFAGIHVLVIGQMQTLILNMNHYHWLLLRLLGEPYEKVYSGDG
jgi:transposase